MIETAREILPILAKHAHQIIIKSDNGTKKSLKDKQLIGDAALSLHSIVSGDFVLPHEKVLIERAFMNSYHVLYNEQSLFYFSSFYYLYQKMKQGDMYEKQNELNRTNLDTMAMLLKITAVNKKLAQL